MGKGLWGDLTKIAIAVPPAGVMFMVAATPSFAAVDDDLVVIDKRTGSAHVDASAASLLREKAARDGTVSLIVGLGLHLRSEDELSLADRGAQQRILRASQDSVLARDLGRTGGEDIIRYRYIPAFAATVTSAELSRLINDPQVVTIEEDSTNELQGYNTTITETGQVWNQHFDGTGWTVAILDTGVDKDHPMLVGKQVSEACYSTTRTVGARKYFSLCPGHKNASLVKGSGSFCSLAIDGCEHGTHVASIAVGRGGVVNGVAKGARFISIQIFSKLLSGCTEGPSPCAVSYDSTMLEALERIYALRNTYKIAAVNISAGSTAVFAGDCDAKFPMFAKVIAELRDANIATVVAAGNEGSTKGINKPACFSSVISVANSDSLDRINLADSNFTSRVSLIAPGTGIYGGVPRGRYDTMTGTSMAAPAVAGAFAVLRQVSKTADVTGLLNVLQCGGQSITLGGVTGLRFDLLRSYNLLKNPPNKTQTFVFSTPRVGSYWTPFLGSWAVDSKGYDLIGFNQKSDHNATWFPSCMGNTEVTADVTRVNGDASTAWATGVVVDGVFDQNKKTVSGYWAIYNDISAITDTYPVQLYRLDNYSFASPGGPGETQLCSDESDAIHHNGRNVIKVTRKGASIGFSVNGVLACSATDTKYKFGNVMLEAEVPVPVPSGQKQAFSTRSVVIKPLLQP